MVLDTNILIAYLDGDREVVAFIYEQKEQGRALFVSSITIAELLSLPTLTETDIRLIKKFVTNFISVDFDAVLAEQTATVRRQYKLSMPDAAIVATALLHNVPLVSRDRDLQKVRELTCIDL